MKKFFFLVLSIIMLAGTAAAVLADDSPFSDVKTSRWSYEAIKYAVEQGYMNGVGDNKFDPAGQMTRGMVVTVLYRREGSPAVTFRDDFTDVIAGKYYSDAVIWAKDEGVVNGITETTFEPNGKITREQLATMLSRFSERCLVSVPERADLSGYPDADKIHSYAKDALAWANEANLIKGMSDGTLSPRGEATREQFATILKRFDETFTLAYNEPVLRSHYTEPEYPLVENADVYVAVDGNDNAIGDFEHPVATFNRAVERVREIKATKTSGDIVVAFKAGDYGPLDLTLTAEDSGTPEQRIIYCKYGDGDVSFAGGVTVKADDFEPLDDGEKEYFNPQNTDRIRKIDLDGILPYVPDPDEFVLFDDETYCVEARLPNRYPDGSDSLLFGALSNDYESLRITSPLIARRLERYDAKSFETMKIYGYIVRGYRKDTFRVGGYDPESKVISILDWYNSDYYGAMRPDWSGVTGQGIEICVTNVPYELDAAHEYWIDPATNVMYVYDPAGEYRIPLGYGEKKIRGADYYAGISLTPLAREYCCMIDTDGAGYLTFRGLDFENAAGGFIFASRSAGIVLDGCSFRDSTGHFAVMFEYSRDGEPLAPVIKNCDFDRSLGAAVVIHDEASGPDRYVNRTDAVVDNCRVARANLTLDIYGAVVLFDASGGTVSHCLFEKCSRSAVTYQGSYDMVIEYNDFNSAMCNSEDGGVIYTWGNQDGSCVIRKNLFRGVSVTAGVGRNTIYCDDGDCGTRLLSNLFYGENPVVFAGSGRDNVFSDNAVIGHGEAGSSSYTEGVTAENEEIVRTTWPTSHHAAKWKTIMNYCDTVPGYAEAFEERRPGAAHLIFDFSRAGEKEFFLAPANTFERNRFINNDAEIYLEFKFNSADYCTVEGNEGFRTTENPVFVNPTLGDYRIRAGVDFPDIEFEKIGRY